MKYGSTVAGMGLSLARGRPTNPARIPTRVGDGRIIAYTGWYYHPEESYRIFEGQFLKNR
jgi:hypothetical protein